MRKRIIRYFEDLQLQAKNVSLNTFNEFLHREIGNEGILINQHVQEIFNDEINSVELDLNRLQISIDSEINHFNNMLAAAGKQGVKHLVKSGAINNKNILIVRDGIGALAKTAGLDIGKFLKFKPWGATKLANGLTGTLAALGLVFEAWDSYKEHERELKFKRGIDKMCDDLNLQQNEIIALIDATDFAISFFPTFSSLNEQVSAIEVEMNSLRRRHELFVKWYHAGEIIDADFKDIRSSEAIG